VSVYVLIGPPGAGKGTQGQILSERLAVPHIASGQMFRDQAGSGTPLGDEVDTFMSRGALVPDDLAIRVVLDRLARPDAAGGAILDGFPRTRLQAVALDKALSQRRSPISAALYLRVGEDDLLRRLAGRWLCRQSGHVYHELYNPPRVAGICDDDGSELYQREDDRPETVRARLSQQLEPMYEVVDYYAGRGVLVPVDAARPIDDVTESLLRAIRDHPGQNSLSPAGGRPAGRS
jgi:adenylate kinase